MINWKKLKTKLPKQWFGDHTTHTNVKLIIDVTDEQIQFNIHQDGVSNATAYNLAKLITDLESGKPILMQNLVDIMPESEMSNLILHHYMEMRSDVGVPCISPSEIFSVNKAQDMRE